MLQDCGAEVITAAASAAEALERMQAERPHVLVSEVGMPGEDGYSLIRRVRPLGPDDGGNVPAVALTAYARSEDRTRSARGVPDAHRETHRSIGIDRHCRQACRANPLIEAAPGDVHEDRGNDLSALRVKETVPQPCSIVKRGSRPDVAVRAGASPTDSAAAMTDTCPFSLRVPPNGGRG